MELIYTFQLLHILPLLEEKREKESSEKNEIVVLFLDITLLGCGLC